MLSNFIRRILGPMAFPLKRWQPPVVPQVYQPPLVPRETPPAPPST